MQTSTTSHLFSLGYHKPALSLCRYTVRGYIHAHVNIVVNRIVVWQKKGIMSSMLLPKSLTITKGPSTPPSPLIKYPHDGLVNRRSGCKVWAKQVPKRTLPSIWPSR